MANRHPASPESAPGAARSRRAFRMLRFGSFAAINGLLLLILAFLAFAHLRDSIPVPRVLLTAVDSKLADHGLRIEIHSLEYYLPSRIVASGIEVYGKEDATPIASFEAAAIDLDSAGFKDLAFEVEKVSLAGGRLFCPAEVSPTGIQEEVAHQVHLHLRRHRDGWRVPASGAALEEARIIVKGRLPDLEPDPDEPLRWDEFTPRLGDAVEWKSHLAGAEGLQAEVRVEPAGSGVALDLLAEATRFEATGWPELTAPRASGRVVFAANGNAVHIADAELTARNIAWEDWQASIAATKFSWDSSQGLSPGAFGFASIYVDRLVTPFGSIDSFCVEAQNDDDAGTDARLSFFRHNGPFRAEGKIDWDTLSATADIEAHLNPNFVLRHPYAADLGFEPDVFFHEPPFVRAKVEGSLAGGLESAKAYLLAGAVEVDDVALDRARVRARYEPGFFEAEEMVLGYDDFETRASYQTDLETADYRFAFEGNLRPDHITPWFRDWWPRIWEEFEFEHPIQGDLLLTGRRREREHTLLRGWVAADGITIREVPFRNVEGSLFIRYGYYNVYDAVLRQAESQATGRVACRLDPETRMPSKWTFDVDSTLGPADIVRLTAPWEPPVFQPFDFNKPPRLKVAGHLGGARSRVEFSGQSHTPLQYHGIPLDRLDLKGAWRDDNLILESFTFEIEGGEGTGKARAWKNNDGDERLRFDLTLDETPFGSTARLLRKFDRNNDEERTGTVAEAGGKVDLMISAEGDRHDPFSFAGEGAFEIREAEFGDLHLFGALSRILSNAPLPLDFTSLQLEDADGVFRINGDVLSFSELNIEGPTAALETAGFYRIPENKLDFSVRLHLMRKSRIPFLSAVLSPVARPLAHMTEIRLSGPLDDPEWRFLLGPRNIVDSITTGEP